MTDKQIIKTLEEMSKDNITGEEDDFERFKLHVSLYKAIKILTEMTQ